MRMVTNRAQIEANIATYNRIATAGGKLMGRLSSHPAWYAVRNKTGEWLFGPSKFVGYADINEKAYLKDSRQLNGRNTEHVLREWFKDVDPQSKLGRELKEAFRDFAAAHGKAPNANWRVSVPMGQLGTELSEKIEAPSRRGTTPTLERILSDPSICGGRPCIKGTRMRVSDVVDLVAHGASQAEILADYPYLTAEDITAALHYAAHAVDHRVLKAA